jgi:type II secretory pathway component GspD/PulD (secretin)
LIAAPQVVAMNNEPAVMRVGSQQAVFVTSVAQSPTGAPGEMEGRLVSMSEGLTLTITPQIGADGVVQMSVSPTFTARQHPSAPTAETSVVEADTVMRVHQGDTVVISGLLRAAVEQRPPPDGRSEKRKPRQDGATAAVAPPSATREFIVLLTPTVVMPGSGAAVSAR